MAKNRALKGDTDAPQQDQEDGPGGEDNTSDQELSELRAQIDGLLAAKAASDARIAELVADVAGEVAKTEHAADRSRRAEALQGAAPTALLLEADFGFHLNGTLRVWHAGALITKRADVAELLEHGAPCRKFREIA